MGVGSSPVPVEGNYLFFKDVTYGTRERNRLDILLPQSDSLNGAVLFFLVGAFLFGFSQLLFLFIVLKTVMGGKKATDQVWEGAKGLEWSVASPAPYHTFSTPPKID